MDIIFLCIRLVITQKAVEKKDCQDKIKLLLNELENKGNDLGLYVLAFIHRSLVNERNDFAPEHNERLEFLWDAVLELVITERLFLDYPEKQEGELTDMRSALVRGRNLAEVAKKLNFNEYLLLGKWEEKSWGREKDYILANTLEAYIWALYLDKGIEDAKEFILSHIYSTLNHILKNKLFKDFKTLFQEYTQAHFDITPHYEVISESGPDHDKSYEVGAYLGEKLIGTGFGSSKKKWQEDAAKNAYQSLHT